MAVRSTASIIIIGDEILKGQIKDTNSHFLCKELYNLGVHVVRTTVVSDDADAISDEVKFSSKRFTYVLTSGGIGPTHDDVTYEGIAKAFDEKLVLNTNLKNIFSQWSFIEESYVCKMSRVPQSAEIHHPVKNFIPIVSVHNVFIFPGIPSYLELAFSHLSSVFSKVSKPFYNSSLYVTVGEYGITSTLNAAVKEFESEVKFGSYPDIENSYFKVKLLLESDSKESLVRAEAFLRSHLPQNSVVGPHPPSSELALKELSDICNSSNDLYDADFSETLEKSFVILEQCFEKYSVQNTCVSFNGGKDCTVLLHLTFLYLRKKNLIAGNTFKVFHVQSQQSFPEIENFIKLCVNRYNLQVLSYKYPIKKALSKMKVEHPEIKAVLMGCRHTDPHCSALLPFQETDSDWPQYMRVNPLSHWSFGDVWKFLGKLQTPYCSLYDRGYTSLGCQHNTLPNEELQSMTKDGGLYYMPAYLLKDPRQERKGRAHKI